MERVETLLKKLQEQFAQQAPPGQLLVTVQLLHAELKQYLDLHAQQSGNTDAAVTISRNEIGLEPLVSEKTETTTPVEEKTVEVLQINEEDIIAELEELKKNAETIQKLSSQNKPAIIFDAEEEDVPTLSHQRQVKKEEKKEVNESMTSASSTVNEKLRQSRIDLGDTMIEPPIRDLRKAIGVNERFQFINELFRGDEAVYERSIKTINSFSILAEAEYWIQRELKVKHGWNDVDALVKQFYLLVKRRFS